MSMQMHCDWCGEPIDELEQTRVELTVYAYRKCGTYTSHCQPHGAYQFHEACTRVTHAIEAILKAEIHQP